MPARRGQIDNSLVVGFAEFEERNRRFLGEMGECRWRRARVLTSNRAMLGWDVGG